MLNDDRDDRPEGEESEYHFSDEDVNYEVETDSPKPAASSTGSGAKDLLNRITRSKRMMISIGVFVALVFVVYKMVAPSSTPALNAITPAQITAQQQASPMTGAQQATAPVNQAQQAAPVNQVNAINPMPQMNQALTQAPAPVAMQQPMQQPQTETMPAQLIAQQPQQQPAPQIQQAEQPQTQASAVMSTPAMQVNMPASTVPSSAVMAQQQPPQPVQQEPVPVVAQQQPQQVPQQPQSLPNQVQLPAVIPVESAAAVTSQSTLVSPAPANVVTAQAENAINQLQAEYQQKLNEYASQNKALQDQLQTLNSRVAGMETQMGQLVQALLRQTAPPPGPPVVHNVEPAAPQIAVAEPRVAYNVQAIIPGRAWLRSDDGETVTVAEGDIIKDLGRVSKIDPYDGVVEINTGTKVVSLSYGAGG